MSKNELEPKEKKSRLFIQSELCKRKDPVIDKFYLQVQKSLANQRKDLLHNILETILQERNKADEIDKNGYDHSYAIVKEKL